VAVVQHVKRLERAGLVMGERQGKRRVYRVQPDGLVPLARWVAAHATAGEARDFNKKLSASGLR
jgi:DNA-binding transcriptional ArsR family regulator